MPNSSNSSIWVKISAPFPAVQKRFTRSGRVTFAFCGLLGVAVLLAPSKIAWGQADQAPATPAAPAPPPPAFAMADLKPALADVQNAITAANLSRWKIPSDVRADTQQDVTSMQRDLSETLPGLMSAADAAPATNGVHALAPAFAVFRNLDALYDVLLRVSEIASVGAAANDAGSLESARAALEGGRGKLGTWLLQAIGSQDSQFAQAVATAAARPAAPPPPPNKVVVDDGPENPKPRRKKPATPPAPQ